MDANTILVFALGLLVGYVFAVYHGKNKRPVVVEVVEAAECADIEVMSRSERRRHFANLPAIDGYVTQRDHSKTLAVAQRTHAAELSSAVEAATEAAYTQSVNGVRDAYILGEELAPQDVSCQPDEFGVRLFKQISRDCVVEVVVAPTGIYYVRGDESDLAFLRNNGKGRKSPPAQRQQPQLQRSTAPFNQGRVSTVVTHQSNDDFMNVPPLDEDYYSGR